MKTKTTMLIVTLGPAIIIAIACLVILKRPTASPKREVALPQPARQPVVVTEAPAPKPVPLPESAIAVTSKIELAQAPVQPKSKSQTTVAPKPDEPRQDPLARSALSLVGIDPDAEAYWLSAIYDSSLSDQEREDLMEDLNEEGLSNPKQPAPEDFPLIVSRIRIIEEIAPFADEFMLEHLGEAYKDLMHLAAGGTAR